MKKQFNKIFAIAFLSIGLFSCSEEEILDLKPANQIQAEDSYTTASLVEASVNGMYNAAAIGFFNGAGARG